MKTASVLIQSLCVPCCSRCRYCLLSWNGTVEGAAWDRSVRTAERFIRELKAQRPDLPVRFSFGYSMEHPDLKGALRTLRRLGSPTAEFLQCDGMRMRSDAQCFELMQMLADEGVKRLNFTVYGLSDYHDRFAGRNGDYALIFRMMSAAKAAGLPFTAGIPLTAENLHEVDALAELLKEAGSEKVFMTVPHEEGRGMLLSAARIDLRGFACLAPETRRLLNRTVFRTEGEWLSEPPQDTRRTILISLRKDNIAAYEAQSALQALRETEALDERYYAAFPRFDALAEAYGDPGGDKLYRFRDLFHHYRRLYARAHDIRVCDVTDERQSGSRRY